MKLNASGLLISVLLVLLSNGIAPGLEQPSMESLRALVDSEVLFGNGIRIELKKGTKLSYPSIVHEHDIPFVLLGEARFKVLSGYRLTVEYDKIVVKATAASFSLEKGRGTIEVTVFSNEASITVDQQQFIIYAFQRATYHVATKQLTLVDTRVKRI